MSLRARKAPLAIAGAAFLALGLSACSAALAAVR